jgi:hypothetical protein
MENEKRNGRNKGGRPKKEIKRDQPLTWKCTLIERKIIEIKARQANCCISEYLRRLVLNAKVETKIKVLPKEILQFTATLNHLAANINQLAKKRNAEEDLNAIERAKLNHLCSEIKGLNEQIKNYLA